MYHRRRDIHSPYEGSWQSGIAPSGDWPLVLLFTGQSGAKYGYDDERTEHGVFLYTGEGQEGHMSFSRGNRDIRDHAKDGSGRTPSLPVSCEGTDATMRLTGQTVRSLTPAECAPREPSSFQEPRRGNLPRTQIGSVPVETARAKR